MRHQLRVYDADWRTQAMCCSAGRLKLVGLYTVDPTCRYRIGRSPGLSASRRYFVTEAAVYSSLDARSTSRARDLLKRPACGRPTRCEDAAPKSPEARRQFTRTEPSPADVRETVRPRAWVTGARGTNAKRVRPARRTDAAARDTLAGELASQRPPSRERLPPGGAGQGHALSPSPCFSPRSRSIDDAEHRLRQVRGPPACSSAGT